MPKWVQLITYLNPPRYFIEVVRSIILKGSGLTALWSELLSMIAFGYVVLSLAVARFQKIIK